jgi:AbrB family looped-hinge helix DNA binding protein
MGHRHEEKFKWVNFIGYCGCGVVGKSRMDERGRILIPLNDREKLGLKVGTEFDLIIENGVLILKPIIPQPIRVNATNRVWGKEAFLDAGEATFGER